MALTFSNKLRRFTESDWDGFLGAEDDKVHGDPLIFEFSFGDDQWGVIVADRNGVELSYSEPGDPMPSETYRIELPTLIASAAIASSMAENFPFVVDEVTIAKLCFDHGLKR